MSGALALTWLDHRRTKELCAGLDIELLVLTTKLRGALRYLVLNARTLALLARRRPEVLLVQNPSLILAALAVAARGVLGYRLIVDAHNEAVVPFINRQWWVARLSRWVIRRADLTIVTNRQLAEVVERCGGRPFTLPDRIPAPPSAQAQAQARALSGAFNVVLIATFAPDEPVAEVLDAVRGTEVELYVTGDHRKLDQGIVATAPQNVRFTGFLNDEDYWSLLRSADAILDLTLMDDCLVCGAYEALALGKPMLLSNNSASVELFGDSAVFTNNTAADIRQALERLRLERVRLQVAAERKRSELADLWTGSARSLRALVAGSRRSARAGGGLVN
jgi:glycosyltransferase involved in cell wall biosynthesis